MPIKPIPIPIPPPRASRTVRLRLRTISRWRNLPKAWRAASEANWIPIGTYKGFDARYYFQGTFDGGGHTITGMTISSASFYYIGLFGYLYGATVRESDDGRI